MITTTHQTPPTERQQAILDFIVKAMRETGRPPTVREIGLEFGFRSPNGTMTHLLALVKKGKLRHATGSARGFMPIGVDGCCPTCGRPIDG
jgi:SOS-response transcriptional repressor LexA